MKRGMIIRNYIAGRSAAAAFVNLAFSSGYSSTSGKRGVRLRAIPLPPKSRCSSLTYGGAASSIEEAFAGDIFVCRSASNRASNTRPGDRPPYMVSGGSGMDKNPFCRRRACSIPIVDPSLMLDSPRWLSVCDSRGGGYCGPVSFPFLFAGYRCCGGAFGLVEAESGAVYGTTTSFLGCCPQRLCCIRGSKDDALVMLVSDSV